MTKKTQIILLLIVSFAIILAISGCIENKAPDQKITSSKFEKLNISNVTTTWNLSFLFSTKEDASAKLEELKLQTKNINETYRQKFENLTGAVLLGYLEDNKEFLKSLDNLWAFSYAENSLNVNDKFYETFLSDIQDASTEHEKATSFATIKLTSISKEEWNKIFAQEPGLEKYRPYLESEYIRFLYHRPQNESHAAYLANIGNQRMKLETNALKEITNNVTVAGNITLDNGEEYAINSQSYYTLLSTDRNRNNRKKGFEKRFYHLINESDRMAKLYSQKAKLDDLYARELNFSDYYEEKMFDSYLTKDQIGIMNSVFKERKSVFDPYLKFRQLKLGVDQLRPYDLLMQLMDEPNKKYNYTDSLLEIQSSYSKMDPVFNAIFLKTVTGNYIDVYPAPENGKQPGGYAISLCALKSPSIIFMNYDGLIDDKKTITHEMGHNINFYLMGNKVDFYYCGGPEYEMEVPSTFNEELFVDYAIGNYDNDTAVAVLSQHIGEYQNYFTFQPLITEFEHEAHKKSEAGDNISGADLNSLWTNLSKEYRSSSIEYYKEDSSEWTYISHIYFTNNYYTFNYAVSKAISLSLFKKYRENPEEFNRNYIEYLSAGATLNPKEKLKKYFNIDIDKKLFEDAMDIVEMRINELKTLENG
ncbi:MAG TPA: M3 family oligoendopeptidase [Candidatus Methanoperedens sp.]